MRYFDNTRLSAFKACPRSFYLRHVRHWKRAGTGIPLAFGLGWHEGMDALWRGVSDGMSDETVIEAACQAFLTTMLSEGIDCTSDVFILENFRNPTTAEEMYRNYLSQRKDFIQSSELIACERPFAVPLRLPGVYYVGRLDKTIKRKDRYFVIEHKTTSLYKKDPDHFRKNFVDSFIPNSQIDGYSYAMFMEYGKAFKSVYVDGAMVHRTCHAAFKFIPVERAFAHLDSWLCDTERWITLLQLEFDRLAEYARKSDVDRDWGHYLPVFPKNTDQCQGKYGYCPFYEICRTMSNPAVEDCPTDLGFEEEKWEPFNELGLNRILEDSHGD